MEHEPAGFLLYYVRFAASTADPSTVSTHCKFRRTVIIGVHDSNQAHITVLIRVKLSKCTTVEDLQCVMS